MFLFMMNYDTVEMIKHFPENLSCNGLGIHSAAVYIVSHARIVQWNVATDVVVKLDGYPGSFIRSLLP